MMAYSLTSAHLAPLLPHCRQYYEVLANRVRIREERRAWVNACMFLTVYRITHIKITLNDAHCFDICFRYGILA
jgi:hypothetical protein